MQATAFVTASQTQDAQVRLLETEAHDDNQTIEKIVLQEKRKAGEGPKSTTSLIDKFKQ